MTYIDLLKMNYWFWFFGGFVTAGVLVSWGLYFLYEKERKNIRSKYRKLIPSDTILRMDRNSFLLLNALDQTELSGFSSRLYQKTKKALSMLI